MKNALFVLLLLTGCPHPPPPTPAPSPDLRADLASPGPRACTTTTTETADGVCQAFFTNDTMCANGTQCACVVCQNDHGCVDRSTEVYCVNGGCGDPACHHVDDPSAGLGTSGARIRIMKKSAPKPVMPKSALTPGATDPHVTQANIQKTICTSGYTKTVRPPVRITNKIKVATFAAYGIHTDSPNDYELDHLISLELGGAPADEKNLWPEPWESHGHKVAAHGTGAETKDKVETWLKRQVCAGKMSLDEAQKKIATNWAAVLEEMPQ